MKIKRLDIIGFKSFVDKVSLDFQQGITAIVGPNGCGKSNIVDAIRWAMGEQSAKNLRGRQMEDVIFGGSESRKPLGMAEVSLVFATDDGRVPARYLDFSEVQVTRRLYRDGESEYLLNKTPCRLLDVAELFMDTGVGTKAYSIIEQGKIGMILLSKPEERRFLIEEAAGVTKFKTRKQVALKKIEVTRQNLLRIGDIVAEIRRQLNSLQRQAKKAEKFREYREELREIEFLLAARSFNLLEGEKLQLGEELARLNQEAADSVCRLEEGELRLEEKRIALLEGEKGLTAAQEEIFRLKGEAQTTENRLEFQRKELLNLERQRARFGEEMESLRHQLAEAEAELKTLEERRGLLAVELGEEESGLTRREAALEELGRGEAELARELEEKRHELFTLLAEIAQFNNQYANAAKRFAAMAERIERNRREKAQLEGLQAEEGKRVEELELALRGLAAGKEEVAAVLAARTRREEELKEELAGKEKVLLNNRDELSGKSSRLSSLQELEAQFAGYGRGVRSLFLAEPFRKRFHGVVADALETDEAYETAVEAVLGERLQYVLGNGTADVAEAIGYLKASAGGRCSFITRDITVSSYPVPFGTVSLLDKVAIAPACRQFIEPLLAGVYLADDLSAAFGLAREYPSLTFVTSQGELVHSAGIAHGGSMDASQEGLIHKKREIKELSGNVTALEESVRELEKAIEMLKGELAVVEEERQGLRQRLHQADLDSANTAKDLLRAREERQRLEERLTLNRLEDDQIREEQEALEREMAESGVGRSGGEERKASLELVVAALQESLIVKRRELGETREMVTAAKVRTAALKEKCESSQRSGKRVEELVSDLRGRIAGHLAELDKGNDESTGITAAIGESEAALKALMFRQAAAEAAFAGIRESYESAGAAVHEDEGLLKALRGCCEEVRQRSGEQSLKLTELVMKQQHLENSLRERFRVEMATILADYGAVSFVEGEKRGRMAELQRLVDEMGEVNLMAIDEYRQLEERYNFLSAQRDDLDDSLQALQQAIQRINRTTRKRFLETFHLVNAKFRDIFPRLFCGGSAELRLTNENDLLETGIDIIVQPPGKKLQNVTLLSGGEKALTAVALIFSIFLIKPSPFCLLDEVDAPLDDANIGRFNEIVREMSATSQFIVITHNKTTMGVADTLYGVTMEEPGVSKLVSVRLN
jgi:chromosome segregation protein